MAVKQTLKLRQYNNPRYDDRKPDSLDNHPYAYEVVTVTNLTTIPVGKWLSKLQVDEAIASGIDTTITSGK